jgi:tripartite-type tricarboxylate transporter receptor subunit TctC
MRFLPKIVAALAGLAICASAAAPIAQPQDFPSRPIRIIVPTAAGGAGDLIARYVGEALSGALHTPVAIENRPGASGVIGNYLAAHAAADGYTLLFATSATHIIASHAIAKLPYDTLRDFTPVINIAYATSVVVVNQALPVTSLSELIAYARAHPGRLNYASSGVGSANHVDTEVFAALADIKLTHVPYRGTADGYRALLQDEVQLMFGAITSALPYIEAGKVRPLAVLVDRRSPLLPGVPTIAQAGLPGVDVRKWLGLVAPAATPPAIVARINGALDAILHLPRARAWLEREGLELAGGTPLDFEVVLRADDAKWAATLHRLRLRSE